MAITDARVAAAVVGGIALGITLQFLGCLLWHNWWPMLTAFMYVLVPMPALFFGGAPGSNLASSWVDAGKFLTGFSAVGSVAIPAILYHAGKIVGGALVMQLVAVGVLAATLFAWDYMSEVDEGGFYSY
ncbi:VPS55 [Auxenochlorella protothecoides x Auxenochlorella symbiontica]|uniref:Vacuolar protein sorting-associated protein 55-like protein n=2 Tax=Auxenochlorella protothecoides TaxID=3075 RepID=A0A087SEI2_AUXPR|nr:Vacuolar protein sorting-associated protein 55-like protein [Auxenochlorella protothecoides]KFM24136.1 Vacuolar protein sorting-associated protein 55-like protein [Auxenochlorella protothecoides]